MPLNLANEGDTYSIKRVGGLAEFRRHLESMGFIVGEEVKMVSKLGGNVIVVVKNTRIAISEEMARKILV